LQEVRVGGEKSRRKNLLHTT